MSGPDMNRRCGQSTGAGYTAPEGPFSLEDVAKALEKRKFATSIVATRQEAADLVMNTLLPASGAASVSFGGSTTVTQLGLMDRIKAVPGLNVLDTYDKSGGAEAMVELRRQALLVDLFITSVNAVSADGRMFLLDLWGNRTAAVQFGPKKVILVVSKNKITGDSHAAIARVRNVASPANAKRLGKKTPCVETGECSDCASPDRICAAWTIMDRCAFPGRIHVVLIDEESGF